MIGKPMARYTYNFRYNELKIDPSLIGRLLEYERSADKEIITGLIDEVLKEATNLCDIKAEFVIFQQVVFKKRTETIWVGGIEFKTGKIISSGLGMSEMIAVFACTAGQWISDRAKELIESKDYLKGYIFDIAGSEIVEAAATLTEEKLRELVAKESLKITNRYSPGYCGWNVSEQHKLFSLLPDNFCGIKLMESSLMVPIKSISGMIGIGHGVKYHPYPCSICDAKKCIYRKLKEKDNQKNS
ncbi:MAG: vitamin B12 dependent-methionine synthase activation domain-containing protein [Bacteroidales bacterium]